MARLNDYTWFERQHIVGGIGDQNENIEKNTLVLDTDTNEYGVVREIFDVGDLVPDFVCEVDFGKETRKVDLSDLKKVYLKENK